ncbi:unnamed protein product [Kluyveromyces dobzhanskii CBS 2104]|uniref:WGS project CCBQ000000000 data, contig 00041 n=1 Tax=Kluyveromyces dobzhanskii CBS 2104 TaxID=1427455 RepID=A0A0A8L293_9SACH|nr:unnamed protein product [Kluyveromyces dobzhanskii CBS 2104]
MTLLALGNAIPDITSTYKAMNRGNTTLAIGESLGAIFFLLTVVIGSMLLVRNIKLSTPAESVPLNFEIEPDSLDIWDTVYYNRKQFLRDLFMFVFLITMNIFLLRDGKIKFWEFFLMCVAYCGYAAYLVISIRQPDASNFDENIPPIVVTEHELQGDENMERFLRTVQDRRNEVRKKIRAYLRKNYAGWANLKLNDTLDLWEKGLIFNHEVDEVITRVASPVVRPLVRSNSETNFQHLQNIPNISLNGSDPQDPSESKSTNSLFIPNKKSMDRLSDNEPNSPDGNDNFLRSTERMSPFRSISVDNFRLMTEQSSILDDMSISNLELQHGISAEPEDQWDSKLRIFKYLSDPTFQTSNFEVLTILITTPIIFVLTLMIPLHYSSKSENHFFIVGYYIQCAFSQFLATLLINREFNVWFFLLGIVTSSILLPLYLKGILSIKAKYLSLFGFFLSIASISFVVGLVLDILTNWVETFNLSEAILGLTVFAWGNSIGDLVSNVTFTKIGVLEIALGSCFGSPLLYFLFGVGVDGMLILMQKEKPADTSIWQNYISFDVNRGLILSCVGITIAFGVFIFVVPLNNWKLDKRIGCLLLSLYGLITTINVCFELNS